MSPQDPTKYAARIESDLRRNILPFWMERVADRKTGKFLGALTNDLVPDRAAERGAILISRILWTYSAAFGQYREPDHLAMADLAYADLIEHFADREAGGYWWSVSADDKVLRDQKRVLGQAFVIYALAEYHSVTGRAEPLERAIEVYRLLEKFALDRRNGGYFEAFDRAWRPISDIRLSEADPNTPKSQDAHLHLMEAYTRLLDTWPDAGLRRTLTALMEVMLSRIVNPVTGHLGQYFSEDWTLQSDKISYGHDIEAAWLMTRAAEVLQDSALAGRIQPLAVKIAEVTLAEGVDSDGGVYYEAGAGGLTNTNKEWWPQAEAVVGFINAFQLSGQERFLGAAFRTWDFIERRLIDHRRGEWFKCVTRDGHVFENEPKVGFWKCPYHNGRTALEAVRRLRGLSGNGSRSPATQ